MDAFFGDYLGVFAERTTAQPTLDVSAISCGWQGETPRHVIPAQAECQLAMRVVAGQDPDKIWTRFVAHVMAFAEPGISVKPELLSLAHPFLMPEDGRETRAIQRALKGALGREALLMRHGGSLAIGGLLQRELQVPGGPCWVMARAATPTRPMSSSASPISSQPPRRPSACYMNWRRTNSPSEAQRTQRKAKTGF